MYTMIIHKPMIIAIALPKSPKKKTAWNAVQREQVHAAFKSSRNADLRTRTKNKWVFWTRGSEKLDPKLTTHFLFR